MNSGYMLHVEHEEYAKGVDKEFERVNHRLKHLEDQEEKQTELLISIKELTTEMKDIKKEVFEQDERLETLENRDGEKWRKAEWAIISGVIMAVLGYILGNLGL
jgi:septal ring factor EnvC (AmiA/AmiB activator)